MAVSGLFGNRRGRFDTLIHKPLRTTGSAQHAHAPVRGAGFSAGDRRESIWVGGLFARTVSGWLTADSREFGVRRGFGQTSSSPERFSERSA